MQRHLQFGAISLGLLAWGCSSTPASEPADVGVDAKSDVKDVGPPVPQTLSLTEVAIFQGVKTTLWKDGATAPQGPVVAGRKGLLRVYFKPGSGWKTKGVNGKLTITSSKRAPLVLEDNRDTYPEDSVDKDIDSTYNFEIPEGVLQTDSAFAFELYRAGTESYIKFPAEGEAPQKFGAISTGDKIKITLVPVRYNADKSGRTPTTSTEALEVYSSRIQSLFPTRKVEITTHPVFDWAEPVAAKGDGWSELLEAIQILRSTDKAAADVYYYGAFQPGETLWGYCDRGCILGLSNLVGDARDASMRASIGVAYADGQSAFTMAHEIGHAHGLPHAPCGEVAGADRLFPQKDGTVGSWGYDFDEGRVISPDYTDLMGYCSPQWMSEYNYKKLLRRVAAVNGLSVPKSFAVKPSPDSGASDPDAEESPPKAPTKTVRILRVKGDGSFVYGGQLTIDHSLSGATKTVTLEADGVSHSLTGHYYPYGDLPGGTLLVDELGLKPRKLSVDVFGASKSLTIR